MRADLAVAPYADLSCFHSADGTTSNARRSDTPRQGGQLGEVQSIFFGQKYMQRIIEHSRARSPEPLESEFLLLRVVKTKLVTINQRLFFKFPGNKMQGTRPRERKKKVQLKK